MHERMLSFHATYRCHDSGACCTAGWPIAIEADRLVHVERALATGDLSATARAPFLRTAGAPVLLATRNGACVFYRASPVKGCRIQHRLGHPALPLACRRFPRVSVIDPRGVSTTLSHYCPTALGLLDTSGPADIVTTEPAAAHIETEAADLGLDVRDSVPPLLRPGMFMDWESWWLFERLAIDLLKQSASTAEGLAALGAVVDRVREWSVGEEPLARKIEGAFLRALDGTAQPRRRPPHDHLSIVLAAIPEPLRPADATLSGRSPAPPAARRLLMSHAFANWTAHLGHGLRTWLRSLEAVDGLIAAGLGAREVDLLLRHLADSAALAAAWREDENR